MTDQIYGGLAFQCTYSLPAHSVAAGWALRGRLVGDAGSIEIDAIYFQELCAGEWQLIWPGSQTAALAAGRYTLQAIASDGSGTELVVQSDQVRVFAAADTDLRSENRKILDNLIALSEGKSLRDHASISYNGRSITRFSWEEIQKAIAELEDKCKRERRRATGKTGFGTVNLRFGS